jgi:hypothetical protein
MRRIMLAFLVVVLMSISVQSALAQSTCRIIVNGGQGAGAYVEASQPGQSVSQGNSGNADNNGVFTATNINIGAHYIVVVRYAGRSNVIDIQAIYDPAYVSV